VSGGGGASQEGGGERGETHCDSRSAVVERGRCGEGDGDVEEQKRVWEGMEVGKRKRKLRFVFVLLSRKERAWAMTKQQHKREGGNLLQQTPDPKSSFEAK
jgi:hypothetical protein